MLGITDTLGAERFHVVGHDWGALVELWDASLDRTPTITVPTLFIWSTDDVALGRAGADATERYVDAPYRFEIIEGGSHWLPETVPDRVAGLLLEHLAAHG